tara:strand:- start:470 stop:802 length:333 start_codon:yes stop_codon:yes gene_type:complete
MYQVRTTPPITGNAHISATAATVSRFNGLPPDVEPAITQPPKKVKNKIDKRKETARIWSMIEGSSINMALLLVSVVVTGAAWGGKHCEASGSLSVAVSDSNTMICAGCKP